MKLRLNTYVKSSVLVLLTLLLLTGCMYPDEMRKESQALPGEYTAVVQQAVERYKEASGVLPIKNSNVNTPLYEKYVIDLKKLMDSGYLSRLPDDAFESGGNYYYVLVDVEDKPRVKLMDLAAKQQVGDVQRVVDSYSFNNGGALPLGEQAADSFYRISYDQLGMKPVQVRSPFSRQYLSLLLHESGRVFIDYAPDIMQAKEKANIIETPDEEKDLRTWLVDASYFVPVDSMPYYWVEGQPKIKAE
jgi:hypothetical protein